MPQAISTSRPPAKSPFKSKTLWGLAGTLVFGLLAAVDIPIGANEQQSLVNAIGLISSFILGLYGRLHSKQPLRLNWQALLKTLTQGNQSTQASAGQDYPTYGSE